MGGLVGIAIAVTLLAQGGSKESPETDLARELRMSAKFGPGYLSVPPTEKLGNDWSLASWSGNAQPYARTRRDIESGVSLNQLVRFAQMARANPKDSLAQFRWVCAEMFLARKKQELGQKPWSTIKGHNLFGQMRWALATAPNPQVAEYSRLRFLMEASQVAVDKLRYLARRLHERWPEDRNVKIATARLLTNFFFG
jgi:hypothetical protein